MRYKDDSTNISGVWTTFMRGTLENKSLDSIREVLKTESRNKKQETRNLSGVSQRMSVLENVE